MRLADFFPDDFGSDEVAPEPTKGGGPRGVCRRLIDKATGNGWQLLELDANAEGTSFYLTLVRGARGTPRRIRISDHPGVTHDCHGSLILHGDTVHVATATVRQRAHENDSARVFRLLFS